MSFLSLESVMFRKKENFSLSSSTRFVGDAFDVRDDDTDDVTADDVIADRIGDDSTFVGLPGNDASMPD